MPTSYTSLLGLALPVTGELSGTWGDTVNSYITQYIDAAVAGTQTISGSQTAVTLSTTNGTALSQAGSGATGSAQYMIINCTGNPASMLTITAPAASKAYLVLNSTSTSRDVKVVGAGPTTGVTLVPGERAVLAWNGSDFVKVVSNVADGVTTLSFGSTGLTPSTATSGAVTVAGTLAIANGGTGSTSTTYCNLAANVTGTLPIANGGTGTTSTTYCNLTTNVTGTLPVSNGGSGAATLTGVLRGNGTSAFTAATAGTDFVAPGTATTFTALQTFSGSASNLAAAFNSSLENITVSATAAGSTVQFDALTQPILYYTSNASGNWTLNVRGNSTTTLNSVMSTGQSITIVFMATNGATPYYQSALTVDGASVTPKWQGGIAVTAGNASGIDVYSVTLIKTGSGTFTALAAQNLFK